MEKNINMASASDIAVSSSNYTGNAALGGGSMGVAKIDTSPINNLAHYTVMFNRDVWEENNKITEAKIKELSDYTTLDYNNAIPKEKQIALDAYNKIQQYSSEYARKRPQGGAERVKQDLEFKQQIAESLKTIKSINARSISYQVQKKAIADKTDLTPEQKDERYKQLDRLANSTDHTTSLPSLEQFDLKVPDVSAPVQRVVSVTHYDGEKEVEEKFSFFDPKNIATSYIEANGMKVIDETSPEWAKLSQTQKDQQLLLKGAKSDARVWNDAAKFFSEALNDAKYKDKDGKIDYGAIQAANPLIHDVIALTDKWNDYSNRMKTAIETGYYTDEQGRKMKLTTGLDANDYFTIDKEKGITAAQMVFLEKFAKAAPDGRDVDFKYTGANTRLEQEGMQQAGQDRRNNADNATQKWIATHRPVGTTAGTGQDGEDGFGNLIYGVNTPVINIAKKDGGNINNVKIVNGVVVDGKGDKVDYSGEVRLPNDSFDNAIITEYNKYVGSARIDPNTGLPSTAPSPTKLATENGKYIVRMKNGEIDGIKADDGSYVSVDQFQHITRGAAIKGTTKYVKPDTNYGTGKGKGKSADPTAGMTPAQKLAYYKNGGK